MGVKAAQQIASLGSKLALAYSLGKKLGRLGQSASNSIKGSSVGKDMGTNNMIENRNSLADISYIPMGGKKNCWRTKKEILFRKKIIIIFYNLSPSGILLIKRAFKPFLLIYNLL